MPDSDHEDLEAAMRAPRCPVCGELQFGGHVWDLAYDDGLTWCDAHNCGKPFRYTRQPGGSWQCTVGHPKGWKREYPQCPPSPSS